MTHHRIIAAEWQLQAAQEKRLGAVIVPLEPQPIEQDDIFVWKCKPIDLFWFKTESVGNRLIEKLQYQIGDRLYLAEEWYNCLVSHDAWGDTEPVTRSSEPDCMHQYQPAETMPEEATVYWYEVMGVSMKQIQMLSISDIEKACWTSDWGEVTAWDEIYPDHPWNADRWVVVLEVKEVANA